MYDYSVISVGLASYMSSQTYIVEIRPQVF